MQPDKMDELCRDLIGLQVRRRFFIGLVNRQTNAARALIRRNLGWRHDMAESERMALAKRAGRILAAALANKAQKDEDAPLFLNICNDLAKFGEGLTPFESARVEIERAMIRGAKQLPVHAWQRAVHGFGEKALAIIVGEAGNLSAYDHDDKLKKRLGLAPYSGKAFSRWRIEGGLTADEWSDAGYRPSRRAELHAVMEPLFKHQTMHAGPYRAIYDRRRAHTAMTHPEWRKIQSHMDGLRIMTQELIADLWSEWRRAKDGVPKAAFQLPAATEVAAAVEPLEPSNRVTVSEYPDERASSPPRHRAAGIAPTQGTAANGSRRLYRRQPQPVRLDGGAGTDAQAEADQGTARMGSMGN